MTQDANFQVEIQHSNKHLAQLDEPQVHHLLLDIQPGEQIPEVRLPVNLAIVFDRSTSMSGPRLDAVRSAVLAILEDMKSEDRASVVAFSDRAEVIVSPDQVRDSSVARARLSTIQPSGGTEIGQGLIAGMEEIRRNYSREGINHIILLSDGHTYADEELCMELANQAAEQGITINSIGIGTDWSRHLLDDLAKKAGGMVTFLSGPEDVTNLLRRIYDSMIVSHVQIDGAFGEQVNLRSAFRVLPDPIPFGDNLPMNLGHLPRDGVIRLLLEIIVHPIGAVNEITLAQFNVSGDILGSDKEGEVHSIEVKVNVTSDPDIKPPPDQIVSALNHVALYRMQEKARHEAELGQVAQAARRLENLAAHLLAEGERDLAKTALNEAVQLTQARGLNAEGKLTFWDRDARNLFDFILTRGMGKDRSHARGDLDLFVSRKDINRLSEFFKEMVNASQTFYIMLISIDKSHKFFERYGQNASNQILEKLLTMFRSMSDEPAIVRRFLPDKFYIASPSNSLGGAKILAGRMRKEARKVSAVDVEGRSTHPLSITIGLAFYPDHGSTLEALFQTANFASFVGKSRGGDCVVPP